MLHSVKVISLITINIITLGILPSYGFSLTVSSKVSASSLIQFSSSKNSSIPSFSLADNRSSSLGQQIDSKAVNTLLGSNDAYYMFGGIPLWKHLSDEQKYQFAQSICNSQGSASDLVVVVIDSLDGVRSTNNHLQSAAIILASMHTLCPDRYREQIRSDYEHLIDSLGDDF
ncbi:MAG: hypothetical protein WAN66_04805 [Limnoraphis robusta]|uniref:Uncharacterized protein n=1 Tax=Limnoraphis robusta CS-951 TaxID=1637645 RepID=A0A0F5YKH9_9CYAN|nr:hypothetical protein [Limnoraphis robusta]KKD39268.1 hypothetical protein WN50_04285 [Limnoraphis robusta CS-951]